MRGERGQITLFVIVGILLLFIIGLFFLLLQNTTPEQPDNDGITEALNNIVGSCIDVIVEEELEILGRTGALPQEGDFPYAFVGDDTTQRPILYGITRNRDVPGNAELLPYALPVPDYPHPSTSLENATRDPTTGRMFLPFQHGFFGDVNFPPPCALEGPNAPGSERACTYYPGRPPGTPAVTSTQEALANRILQRVQACATPDQIERTLGVEVFLEGTPDAQVTFTYTNTLVEIMYPLSIEGETDVHSISRQYPIRYLSIVQFARDLALQDTRDIHFELSDYKELPSYRPGFTVSKSLVEVTPQRVLSDPLDTIAYLVTITDTASKVDGLTYTFSFLVEDRPPMLDKIKGRVGCIPITNDPLPELRAAGIVDGVDPDDGPVELRWCHDWSGSPQSCGGMYLLYAIDENGKLDWEKTACFV